jgi:4-aminobutyrate aminotransferase-like enzyme
MTTQPKPMPSRSEEVVRKHKEYIWPAVTNYYQKPLVADHASMQYLWDIEGNKYLDFFGGIVTIGVGHCNPKVTAKINAQVNKLQHTSTLFPNEAIVALAEKIAQITPGKLQKSFFTSSGTEANEAAILLARMVGPSYDVVALRHAYAGSSMLAKAVTAQSHWRKSGVISVGVSHAINPYCYRCPLHLTYPDCNVACANDVENLIQTGTSGSIAAFIAEPIQGVGGFITPPPEYFKIVYRIVKQYGGLFISDEVQTGWGRTGKKWFGIEQWEVTPDIITSAKSMANGVPVGLTARRQIPGTHHLDVRRQSRYVRRGARCNRGDRRGEPPREHARRRRLLPQEARRATAEISSDRRRPRHGPDASPRTRKRPPDQRASRRGSHASNGARTRKRPPNRQGRPPRQHDSHGPADEHLKGRRRRSHPPPR